jgi:hypothetical protein
VALIIQKEKKMPKKSKEKKEIRIFKNFPGERTARFKYVTGTWIGLYILGWRKYD